jgi:putative transposase
MRKLECALQCLRSARVFPAVRPSIAAGGHVDFRIVQFSVQNDHVHLLAARALTTPRAVRHALVYVLMNCKKHLRRTGPELDPCSSAGWFTGWRTPMAAAAVGPPPVARARTWLASIGWRRHGLIEAAERPK